MIARRLRINRPISVASKARKWAAASTGKASGGNGRKRPSGVAAAGAAAFWLGLAAFARESSGAECETVRLEYPIGARGRPWGDEEKRRWRDSRVKPDDRSYDATVAKPLREMAFASRNLEGFHPVKYGILSPEGAREELPLMAIVPHAFKPRGRPRDPGRCHVEHFYNGDCSDAEVERAKSKPTVLVTGGTIFVGPPAPPRPTDPAPTSPDLPRPAMIARRLRINRPLSVASTSRKWMAASTGKASGGNGPSLPLSGVAAAGAAAFWLGLATCACESAGAECETSDDRSYNATVAKPLREMAFAPRNLEGFHLVKYGILSPEGAREELPLMAIVPHAFKPRGRPRDPGRCHVEHFYNGDCSDAEVERAKSKPTVLVTGGTICVLALGPSSHLHTHYYAGNQGGSAISLVWKGKALFPVFQYSGDHLRVAIELRTQRKMGRYGRRSQQIVWAEEQILSQSDEDGRIDNAAGISGRSGIQSKLLRAKGQM
ncbi:hypothetical protein ACHAWF_006913 [Thalassiosira exigua]